MRALRFWTTTLLVFGLLMVLGVPLMLAKKPPQQAAESIRLKYAALMTSYAMLVLLVFLGVMILAYLLMRRQREEFREAALTNLKELVEGSLQDHSAEEKDEA